MHHAHELVPQALLVHLAELRELGSLDGCIELHVGADTRQELLLLDLLEEEVLLALVRLVGVKVLGPVEVRQSGRDELWASIGEELLEAQLFTTLQPRLLLPVLVSHGLLQRLIHRSRTEGHADQQQRVHLVLLLHHLVVLVRQIVHTRGLGEENKNVAEGLDGIDIAPQHQVRKAHVVIEGHVASRDLVEQWNLRVEIDAINGLHCQVVVREQAVHAEQLHDPEVAEEPRCLVFEGTPGKAVGILGILQVLLDLGGLDELVQVVQNLGSPKDLWVVPYLLHFFFALLPHCLVPEVAISLVVVDELIQQVPHPLRWQRH
mmetsp:Transcript_115967/g.322972  ORF Transcript_115967/g.322972 Transcript_115967/m.322972 type:complete len:319 (-) Transcript_115967:512-1468(-)